MKFFILFALIFFIIWIFVISGILLLVLKIFKIKNPSYKKSFIILIISSIVGLLVEFIIGIINFDLFADLTTMIASFFVFHYFLKKYYSSNWKKSLGIYFVFGIIGCIISFLIIVPVRLYLVSPFIVVGETMSPAYNNGDYLLINKFDQSFARGEVIIFHYPKDQRQFLIKRIIGLPGEKIEIRGGKIFINDQELLENYFDGNTFPDSLITLKNDQYFVLGDNRDKSLDSRIFGSINKLEIEGKIFYKIPNFK